MDFGRCHAAEASVASQSGIRYLSPEEAASLIRESRPKPQPGDEEKEEDDHDDSEALDALDLQSLRAANKAARTLFLGTSASSSPSSCDAAHYEDRSLPPQACIEEGDLVVVLLSFDSLQFVYAQRNAILSNRNGHFHHNDFLGLPFGSKVRSRTHQGYGFCHLLKPTPELWARSLPHRTQIVHELDQAQIVMQLHLRPNMRVVEAGTGSAALSHALLRTIAPHGHLHTFEFSRHRAETARDELQRHGLARLVTLQNVDVCSLGFVGVSVSSVDAVMLDLPEPWKAVPHARRVLRPNVGRLANYSPCIEQTQRTCLALQEAGFHSIQTFEYRLMEYHVDTDVTYQSPPLQAKRPCLLDPNYKPEQKRTLEAGETINNNSSSGGDVTGVPPTKKLKQKETTTDDAKEPTPTEKKTTTAMTVARPFNVMRGHTAFLTFATAGPPPPLEEKQVAGEGGD